MCYGETVTADTRPGQPPQEGSHWQDESRRTGGIDQVGSLWRTAPYVTEDHSMRNVRMLVLAVIVALVGGLLLQIALAQPASANTNAKAYYQVRHKDTGGNAVRVSDGYTVEYRLFDSTVPPFGAWQTTWTSRTGTGVVDGTCTSGSTSDKWKYETLAFDDSIYTAVEWRVTMTAGYAGTRCSDSANKSYASTETLTSQTYSGGTATSNAYNYQ